MQTAFITVVMTTDYNCTHTILKLLNLTISCCIQKEIWFGKINAANVLVVIAIISRELGWKTKRDCW